MLHMILAALSLAAFFLFTLLLIPVEWVIGKFSVRAQDTSRLKIVQGYLRLLLFLCGTKVTLIGREKLPADTPVLYALNHRSVFDIVATLAWCPSMTGYIAKKEFERVPLLSWWIRWTHGFFLDRTSLKEGLKTILSAIEQVRGGISIAVFPEGTRSREADERVLLPFHEGSFKIAVKAGCPVIPVAISHSSQIFGDHFPLISSTHVIIEYGDPIDPKRLAGEEKKFIGKYTRSLIREMLVKNYGM